MKWGNRLKKLREDKGMSQPDLAEKSGIKEAHLSHMEHDYYQSLKQDYLNALARAFEMTPEAFSSYIYGNTFPQKSTDSDLIFELDKRIKVLPIPIRGYINCGVPAPVEAVDLGVTYVERDMISGVKNVSDLFGLNVCGESLLGDGVVNGATVIIDPNQKDIINKKIYAVKLADDTVCARHVTLETGYAVLTSSSGEYERIEVDKLEIVGRLILKGKPDWEKL